MATSNTSDPVLDAVNVAPLTEQEQKNTIGKVSISGYPSFVDNTSIAKQIELNKKLAPLGQTLATILQQELGYALYNAEFDAWVITTTGTSSNLGTQTGPGDPRFLNSDYLSSTPGSNTLPNNGSSSNFDRPQVACVNPLHDYDTYTYSLSLHLISTDQFKAVIEDPKKEYIPKHVLVSSAGRYNDNTFARNKFFTEDFFFEEFKMTTYISTTQRSRNSNLIECSFTIIEPNGFTFINRLMSASYSSVANGGVASKNYLAQPYILQIDFFGTRGDNMTMGKIPNCTKILPIRLIDMQSRISSKGTEYRFTATAFNHQAYNQSIVVTPANFQVKATTVAEVFGLGSVQKTDVISFEQQQRLEQQNEQAKRDVLTSRSAPTANPLDSWQASGSLGKTLDNKVFTVTGLTDAYNAYYAALKDRKQISGVNKISVKFHESIGNALLHPKSGPVNITQATAGGGQSETDKKTDIQLAGNATKGRIDFNSGTLNVAAGTQIDVLIDWAIRNSAYIGKQLLDPTSSERRDVTGATQLKTPLQHYKIVPQLKLLDYDEKNGRYAMEVTYYVKPFIMQSSYPYGPLGRVPGWVKEYNYIFTGGRSRVTGENLSNRDVIDLQLEFNMNYYNQITSTRNFGRLGETAQNTAGDQKLQRENDGALGNSNGDAPNAGSYPTIPWDPAQPRTNNFVANDITRSNRTGPNQAQAVDGADLSNSLMLSAKGDMINIKLKIIGDPQLIKQDDIFYGQGLEATTSQWISDSNNSLWMDNGELYVFVNFKSPQDYDERTGLAVSDNSQTNYSSFSGVYKIITIDNLFSRGKFEQTLDLVKLPITDNVRNMNSYARESTVTNLTSSLNYTEPLARSAGPRVLQNQINSAANNAFAAASSLANSVTGRLTQVTKDAVEGKLSQFTGEVTGLLTTGLKDISDQLPSLNTIKNIQLVLADPNSLVDTAINTVTSEANQLVNSAFDSVTSLFS